MELKKRLPVVLLVSASDPDGALGIQADMSVLSSIPERTLVTTVVTSHILRDPVKGITLKAVPPLVLRSQLQAALETFRPDVVIIGLLPDAVSVCEVASVLAARHVPKVIYGPTLKDTDGTFLVTDDTLKAVCCHLIPVVSLLLSDRSDAEVLISHKQTMMKKQNVDRKDIQGMSSVQLSRCMVSTFLCACYLLVPGKHDILAFKNEIFHYRSVEDRNESSESAASVPETTASETEKTSEINASATNASATKHYSNDALQSSSDTKKTSHSPSYIKYDAGHETAVPAPLGGDNAFPASDRSKQSEQTVYPSGMQQPETSAGFPAKDRESAAPASGNHLENYSRFRHFPSVVAGYWAGEPHFVLPLYKAKKLVQRQACRGRYIGKNHADAPLYPLTDGGNYE